MDTQLSSVPTPEASFFNAPSSVSADIKMVVKALQDSNARYRFVFQLQKVYGNPVWNKIVSIVKTENDTSVYLTNSGTQSAQKIYFIPLQKAQLLPVGAYIVCVQSDTGYQFSLFQKSKLEVATPETVDAESYILAALSVFSVFEKKLNNKDTLYIAGRYNKKITDARLIFSLANSTSAGIAVNSYSSNTLTYCYNVDCASGTSIPWGTVSTWVPVCEICYTVTNFQGGSGMGDGGGFTWPGLYSFHEFLDPATGPSFGGGGGSSGGGGGGTTGGFSPTVTALSNQLRLSYAQSLWLENNLLRANELYSYLQSTTNLRAKIIAKEHIDKMMSDLDYLAFIRQYYSNSSTSNVWWEDDNWLDDPNNFNLDLDQDQNGQYDRLTAAEKALVKKYPIHAYTISKNKPIAENETIAIFSQNGLNDKSDAFRHAFFNAMNRRDLGLDPITLENIAKLFSDAHESEVPSHLQKEKDMDLWNNNIGHMVGNVIFPIFTSNSSLSSEVLTRLTNGELRYLKPVEPTPPPGSNGLNNDFWHINGNPQLGRHGITSATQLTPTNQ